MIRNVQAVSHEVQVDLLPDREDLVERSIERKEFGSKDGVPALVAVCVCPGISQGRSAVPLVDASA